MTEILGRLSPIAEIIDKYTLIAKISYISNNNAVLCNGDYGLAYSKM